MWFLKTTVMKNQNKILRYLKVWLWGTTVVQFSAKWVHISPAFAAECQGMYTTNGTLMPFLTYAILCPAFIHQSYAVYCNWSRIPLLAPVCVSWTSSVPLWPQTRVSLLRPFKMATQLRPNKPYIMVTEIRPPPLSRSNFLVRKRFFLHSRVRSSIADMQHLVFPQSIRLLI
jgi:hypothetical protein